MNRGDVVVAAAKGAFSGKPRPAVVIQTDLLNPTHPSLILAPITTDLRDLPGFRIRVPPSEENGLREVSEIMIDKPLTVPRANVQQRIGRIDAETLGKLNRALMIVLGLA
ncbi:type II toxin-antitoxin system PemK/MazF family toxin [Azospirillum sp.]|uniref:type II toxin-antitoxin system PemK/MazF family toxin n=1 Tax=Azospirillum sp. TaxID=34012 RepID=UPI002D64C73B|nr:type II toxin-antitoxin system PemK/MazF family toxin [Azospirillum sp.]HYD69121.1 type II toxin-antitoxin system PemK/MazF family toxin [Azospirillum sp.]